MITLQFVQSSGLGSSAIQLFEHGWCSHVDCLMPDGTLLGSQSGIIGGKPAGVQIRPLNYEPLTRWERVTLPLNDKQTAAFYAFLKDQIGKPYDETAIVAFAVDRNWREQDSWFCSELMAAALEASGWFTRALSNDFNKITPSDLLLLTSPWSVTPLVKNDTVSA
jgi:hypothetical protein